MSLLKNIKLTIYKKTSENFDSDYNGLLQRLIYAYDYVGSDRATGTFIRTCRSNL